MEGGELAAVEIERGRLKNRKKKKKKKKKKKRIFNALGEIAKSVIASTELHWLSPKSDPVAHFPKISL